MTFTEKMNIPFYDLYGESFVRLDPGFVHIESIVSRSRDLGWKIKPHRHDKLAQIICVFDNTWEVELDTRHYSLVGNWLVVIPAGIVHGFHFAPDTKGFVLSVHEELLEQLNTAKDSLDLADTVWRAQPVEFLDSNQMHRFNTLVNLLCDELSGNELRGQHATTHYLTLLLISIARQRQLDDLQSDTGSREARILLKFRELIEQHYTEHWTVNDYASHLYLSVSSLNRLCHQMLKMSPKRIIRQRLHAESKRRLIYTRQSVDDIALTLGYKDPAYFCRQFKQQEGLTASTYRRYNRM